jgi:hypothetical protein
MDGFLGARAKEKWLVRIYEASKDVQLTMMTAIDSLESY